MADLRRIRLRHSFFGLRRTLAESAAGPPGGFARGPPKVSADPFGSTADQRWTTVRPFNSHLLCHARIDGLQLYAFGELCARMHAESFSVFRSILKPTCNFSLLYTVFKSSLISSAQKDMGRPREKILNYQHQTCES